MSEKQRFIGIDWGDPRNQSKSIGILVELDDEGKIGVLQEFELPKRQVARIKQLNLPKDFILVPEEER